jgi:pyruvate dehydrogenase E1 component alpha subunit
MLLFIARSRTEELELSCSQYSKREMAADGLYKMKKIRGVCHLSTSQETIATGIEHAVTKEDAVITAYRCHGCAYLGRDAGSYDYGSEH